MWSSFPTCHLQKQPQRSSMTCPWKPVCSLPSIYCSHQTWPGEPHTVWELWKFTPGVEAFGPGDPAEGCCRAQWWTVGGQRLDSEHCTWEDPVSCLRHCLPGICSMSTNWQNSVLSAFEKVPTLNYKNIYNFACCFCPAFSLQVLFQTSFLFLFKFFKFFLKFF